MKDSIILPSLSIVGPGSPKINIPAPTLFLIVSPPNQLVPPLVETYQPTLNGAPETPAVAFADPNKMF